MTFKELGLIPPILEALTEQGYEKPSPIQEKAIAPALAGRDVLGCAQTGTGKTCAFATPILQLLSRQQPAARAIRALILTPTRELALQIQESFVGYGKHLSLRSAVIFGGVGQAPQVDKLKRGLDILVATPGRLMDLQGQGFVDLSKLEIFVLDEADRMLDMGFIHDVRRILKFLPEQKQTLFFSATMPPEITQLVNSLLKNPVKVAVDPVSSPVEVIDQSVYLVDKGNKSKLLAQLIRTLSVKNALIFTRTKHGANKVAQDLEKAGVSAAAIHGNKSQTARQQALADFKSGRVQALVATDIAARGLDIEELSHVFNYNLPEVAETYIHRIGRTGRAGRGGTAVSFCDFGEQQYLKDIERLIGRSIPRVETHDWPMEVFEAAVKDARGKLVNADDAEARAAARDRKRERELAAKAAAPKRTTTTPPAKAAAAKPPPPRPARG
ncbi:MAG: DEAD/DEAH box helicase, partial [Pseudoflavonifractor sp.]